MKEILNRKLIILDFETDGLFNTEKELEDGLCNPVQIASVAIDLKKLDFVKGSEFELKIKPEDIDNPDYFEIHEKTINWHGRLHNKEPHKIVEEWKTYMPSKDGFREYDEYIKRFNPNNIYKKQPIIGGQNVKNFDVPILQNCYRKYGLTYRFNKRDIVDLKDYMLHWFMFAPGSPSSLNLDTVRDHFGMSSENAHDALQDVYDTGELLLRFLKLHQNIAPKISAFNKIG